MDYLTYLTQHPEVYERFSRVINRTEHLSEYIYQHDIIPQGSSCLSIGCGSGELEIKLAKDLGLTLSVFDPTKSYIQQFDKDVTAANISASLVSSQVCSFQDYVISEQFDTVLSIHSWYGMGCDIALLEKALDCVKPGGQLFINIMSEKSPVYPLCCLSQAGGIHLSAEQLSSWAKGINKPHDFQLEHAKRPVDIFFHDKHLAREAQDFVSFLLAVPWQDLELAMQEKSRDILQAHIIDESIDIVSGCLCFQKAE